jgi:serine/threonine protein kinase
MEVYIKGKGKGKVNLTQRDFLNAGGEGEIYAKGGNAYKIYLHKKRMIPVSKIRELSVITEPNVIKPQDILMDKTNEPVGYSMRHLVDTYSLCQLFTKAFRDRMHVSNDMILSLVQKMQQTIAHIHSKKILIVDLNEMNFLVDNKFKDVFFIDVDSYQTPSFPATAIMDSIKDRHNKTFTEGTDWFSFGIVSFNLFIGLHPFKGKHATLKTLDERMLANMPVFHKDVSYPKVCQPFAVIPQAYRDWYRAIFTGNIRIAPPSSAQTTIVIPVNRIINGNTDFDIFKMFSYNEDIVKYISINGTHIVITTENIYKNDYKLDKAKTDMHIAITPQGGELIYGYIEDNKINLFSAITNKKIDCDIAAEKMMSYNNRIFIKNDDKLSELNFIEIPNNLQVTAHLVSSILPNATKLFDGIVIQNMLGTYVIEVFPKQNICHQIFLPEIKGYQIVDAKYDNQVLIIIGSKKGKYDKFIFKFKEDFSTYKLRIVNDISYQGINFVVLDNGITVNLTENEEIEIFSNKESSTTVKVISNDTISNDMQLFKNGTQVIFTQGKELYRIKMK